jgi:3-phenylpropionate/trans-cinnamate dioxygenase ferredoxin subunit
VSDWVTVGAAADIPPGHAALVVIDGVQVAVFNVNGEFHAVDDVCSHAEASLSEGELDPESCTIECPMHGSCFDLRSGKPTGPPATAAVPTYQVKIDGDDVLVALP